MFKLLRWVSVFLMMTSGVSYAMETSSSDDIDFKKSVLRQAIDFCDRYIDFESDSIEFYQEEKNSKSKQSINNNNSSFSYDEEIKVLSSNISLMKEFKIKFEDETRFNAETVLSDLLDARFSFLFYRRAIMKEVRSRVKKVMDGVEQWEQGSSTIYGPTRPDFFEHLSPYEQVLARNSTDRYQTINGLIVFIWKLVDPRMLNVENKLKVRASTSLWDNLMGNRDFLGHPDEAILLYEDGSDLPNVKLYGNDVVLYDDYIKKQKITIDLLGWAKGKKMNMMTTVYEVSLWDEKRSFYNKIPEAPYPDWLKPYPKLETAPAKALPSKPSQKAGKLTNSSHAKKNKKTPKKGKKQGTPSFPAAKPLMGIEEENINSIPRAETIPSAILEEESDEEEEEGNSGSAADDGVKSFNDYVRPSGMRRFHVNSYRKMEVQAEPKGILKGTHLATRDEIFHPKQFKNVNFGQFKSLWKHVAGEKSVIESTGSSHKKLIGPNGEVFGTFAHGDAMTYGPRTIKYIRDALIQIGYGPSEE
jgi:hypothetical protein